MITSICTHPYTRVKRTVHSYKYKTGLYWYFRSSFKSANSNPLSNIYFSDTEAFLHHHERH